MHDSAVKPDEYGIYFMFGLDGSIELEIKATGILNSYCLAPGEKAEKTREVEVSPRVSAQHHQHVSWLWPSVAIPSSPTS
jgi:Cu2+-containing amine oxidase